MLKERARILAVLIFLLDLLLVSAAFLTAFSLRSWLLPLVAPRAFPSCTNWPTACASCVAARR